MPKDVNEPGHRGTLHEFFPTVVLDPPKARRLLDAPTPSPRKKALKNGRTNAPVPFARPEAAKSDLLRRIRPRGLAVVHPPRRTVTIPAAPGVRELRDVPLTVEDLWQGSHGGPPHVDDVPEEDCCSICLQLVSHPVFYRCGHGHCYTCARIWLEEQWGCPLCGVVIVSPPFRIPVFDNFVKKVYGDWDTSVVDYEWSGLTFPVLGQGIAAQT